MYASERMISSERNANAIARIMEPQTERGQRDAKRDGSPAERRAAGHAERAASASGFFSQPCIAPPQDRQRRARERHAEHARHTHRENDRTGSHPHRQSQTAFRSPSARFQRRPRCKRKTQSAMTASVTAQTYEFACAKAVPPAPVCFRARGTAARPRPLWALRRIVVCDCLQHKVESAARRPPDAGRARKCCPAD